MKIIDLSHPISTEMPVYPGTERPVFINACTIEREGFAEKKITLFTHTGTHLDAPAHILPGAETVDLMPARCFYGRAVVLDFTGIRERKIGPADLEPHRRAVEKSEFLLLYTGWSRLWGKEAYFRGFPVLSPEGARWVSRFHLKGVGVDAISVDEVGSTRFPVHKILLQHGLIVIENLTNLEELTGRHFSFCCFPLKINDADGSPVRAVALLNP
ncbi:MAG: cyclase family protein [Peptococcaceae bacterium]|nr:cyclase family protein [Peptococcaceae bacterium]